MVQCRPTVVAVPARDEAERIGACLKALMDQRGLGGGPLPAGAVRIVVLADNCSDETARIARRCGGLIDVIETKLSPVNAGVARRAAMDAAAARLPADGAGLICTTDADSRPRPDWITRLWAEIDAGAEAVAGAVEFEPAELTPAAFSDRRRTESLYASLQAEIVALADPEAHNPWPNHIWAWGANLAVTASAYRRVGGLPAEPLAEDRAFVERLRRHDVPVRHSLEARVWTSARRVGRAHGGLASLVDDHAGLDDAPCDAALEPAGLAWCRAVWRRRLREAYVGRPHVELDGELAARLRIDPCTLHQALAQATFGAAWASIAAASPRLAARRLSPSDLSGEITQAKRLLRHLDPRGPVDPADRIRAASAGLWSMSASPP